jgi:hypothetical protein
MHLHKIVGSKKQKNPKMKDSKSYFNFVKPTLIFCLVGLFIPGFTAILFFLFQSITYKNGIECDVYWQTLFIFSGFLSIILPIYFIINLKKSIQNRNNLLTKLTLFNFLEYLFIQVFLGRFFTNEKLICYGSGGQNGIELVFSAWLSLPIIILISYFINQNQSKW